MYDAIIVGAGPGEATTATCMARRGLRVLLLDKDTSPRDKICGDAISCMFDDLSERRKLVSPLFYLRVLAA